MNIQFDQAKRDKTLEERSLDFARADEIFTGQHLTRIDDRQEYGEDRYITAGMLDGRIVIMVWTPRGETCRIISMRKANEREIKRLQAHLG